MFRETTFSYWDLEPVDIKKGGGIDQISPWKIHPQPDGSVWLNLEALYNTLKPTVSLGYYSAVNNGPAIVVQYGLDGKPTQELVIPKFSTSSTGSGMGHLMLINKGKLAFLYNDNEKNHSLGIKVASDLKPGQVADFIKPPNGQKDACSTLYYQDEKNKFKTQKLFNFKETKYWFDPYSVYQLSPTTYIIGCNGRAGVFGLLRVDWKE